MLGAMAVGTPGVPFNPFSFVFGNAQPFASSPEAAAQATPPAPAPASPVAAAAAASPASAPSSPFNPFQFVFGNSNPFAAPPGSSTSDDSSDDGAFAAAGSTGRKMLQV